MAEVGKYIYGIINSNTNLKLFTPNGFYGTEKVYSIPYQDISALVNDSQIVDYTHMPKESLARLLVKHQKIIERIMSSGCTVIPLKLGTYSVDGNQTRDVLKKGYRVIKKVFRKIRNKIEIDVVATWSDFNLVLKEVGEEKKIRELKERLLANPKGFSMDEQMQVGVMVKKALDAKREKYAQQIKDGLRVISSEFKIHELMDDKMVVNAAFLIDKSKEKEFNEKAEELNTHFYEKLNFRCVGPLPPYSFYTLEIKKIQFEEIDWARKKLGLNGSISKEQIKKAYKDKALSYHPDRNPGVPGIEREFDELKRAYEMLIDYWLASENGEKSGCIFNEDEIKKNAILVKMREEHGKGR